MLNLKSQKIDTVVYLQYIKRVNTLVLPNEKFNTQLEAKI